jgi:hypothetical protein
MDAKTYLEQQHQEIRALFRRVERAKGPDKNRFFEELGARLVGHDAIEREIFYPACERKMGMTEELGESLVEHGVVEFGLHRADISRNKPDFDYCVTVLREHLEEHLEEEEGSFIPKAVRSLGRDMMEDLGEMMEERFKESMEEDWRNVLRTNLRQVIAGAIKTVPAKKVSARAVGRPRRGAPMPRKRAAAKKKGAGAKRKGSAARRS